MLFEITARRRPRTSAAAASPAPAGPPSPPAPPSPTSAATPSPKIPPRWAVGLVALVLIITGALVGVGRPVGAVLWALAVAGGLGVELVRQLNREL